MLYNLYSEEIEGNIQPIASDCSDGVHLVFGAGAVFFYLAQSYKSGQ